MFHINFKNETASKSDMEGIHEKMKNQVASAVDPLQYEMPDFRPRPVESRPVSGFDERQFQILFMAFAHKRIAFIGYTGADLAESVSDIEPFLNISTSPPSFHVPQQVSDK